MGSTGGGGLCCPGPCPFSCGRHRADRHCPGRWVTWWGWGRRPRTAPGAREKEPIWSWATPLQGSHLGDQTLPPVARARPPSIRGGQSCLSPPGLQAAFPGKASSLSSTSWGLYPPPPPHSRPANRGAELVCLRGGARVRGNLQDVPRSFLRAGGANPLPSLPTCTHRLVE